MDRDRLADANTCVKTCTWANSNVNTTHHKRELLPMAPYACVDMGNKSETGFWQPLRPLRPPNSLGDLKSVSPITCLSMCILLIWCGPFWQPLRPPQPPNSPRVQIWPQIWNQWPHLPTYPCAYWLYDMGSFGSLRGHHSLKTASEVKHDLNLNSGTQITYFSMSTLLTCVAIAAGNKPFRHFVGYHNNRH